MEQRFSQEELVHLVSSLMKKLTPSLLEEGTFLYTTQSGASERKTEYREYPVVMRKLVRPAERLSQSDKEAIAKQLEIAFQKWKQTTQMEGIPDTLSDKAKNWMVNNAFVFGITPDNADALQSNMALFEDMFFYASHLGGDTVEHQKRFLNLLMGFTAQEMDAMKIRDTSMPDAMAKEWYRFFRDSTLRAVLKTNPILRRYFEQNPAGFVTGLGIALSVTSPSTSVPDNFVSAAGSLHTAGVLLERLKKNTGLDDATILHAMFTETNPQRKYGSYTAQQIVETALEELHKIVSPEQAAVAEIVPKEVGGFKLRLYADAYEQSGGSLKLLEADRRKVEVSDVPAEKAEKIQQIMQQRRGLFVHKTAVEAGQEPVQMVLTPEGYKPTPIKEGSVQRKKLAVGRGQIIQPVFVSGEEVISGGGGAMKDNMIKAVMVFLRALHRVQSPNQFKPSFADVPYEEQALEYVHKHAVSVSEEAQIQSTLDETFGGGMSKTRYFAKLTIGLLPNDYQSYVTDIHQHSMFLAHLRSVYGDGFDSLNPDMNRALEKHNKHWLGLGYGVGLDDKNNFVVYDLTDNEQLAKFNQFLQNNPDLQTRIGVNQVVFKNPDKIKEDFSENRKGIFRTGQTQPKRGVLGQFKMIIRKQAKDIVPSAEQWSEQSLQERLQNYINTQLQFMQEEGIRFSDEKRGDKQIPVIEWFSRADGGEVLVDQQGNPIREANTDYFFGGQKIGTTEAVIGGRKRAVSQAAMKGKYFAKRLENLRLTSDFNPFFAHSLNLENQTDVNEALHTQSIGHLTGQKDWTEEDNLRLHVRQHTAEAAEYQPTNWCNLRGQATMLTGWNK